MKNIIIIHHTAVSYDKNPNQFDAVKQYHIDKEWNDIGYHYFIEKDGTIKYGRDESIDGAHCSQEMMNHLSIGICLCGHFDEEKPTQEQYDVLSLLINQIQDNNGKCEIYPHNKFATYKTCPGENFDFNKLNTMNNETVKAVRNKLALGISENISAYWNTVDEDKRPLVEEAKKLILQSNT